MELIRADKMTNADIRTLLFTNGIKVWELAHELGVHPTTVSRKMRFELQEDDKQKYLAAVENIIERKSNGI